MSLWKNAFSNQSALFRTSDGGMLRVNEFRRVGLGGGRSVRGSIYGTEGTFEEQANGAIWSTRDKKVFPIEDQLRCRDVRQEEMDRIKVDPALLAEFSEGFAKVHEKYRERLPSSYRDQPNGHQGSHQFLTDDFITAAANGTRPTVSVWDAARFNAPGIVALESSLREGAHLPVPDFGTGDQPERDRR